MLLSQHALEVNESFNIIGFCVYCEMKQQLLLLRIKDFDYDECFELIWYDNQFKNYLNKPLLLKNLSMNQNHSIVTSFTSLIQILPIIPNHQIQRVLPTYLEFPWFSSNFYIWIHMEIENIYRFAVTNFNSYYQVECNFIGQCNSQIYIVYE